MDIERKLISAGSSYYFKPCLVYALKIPLCRAASESSCLGAQLNLTLVYIRLVSCFPYLFNYYIHAFPTILTFTSRLDISKPR